MGDHVTALPEETMENTPCDFVIADQLIDTTAKRISTFFEDGTMGFIIQGRRNPGDKPRTLNAGIIPALGPGQGYRFWDL